MKVALFSTNLYPTPPEKEKIIYAPLWLTYHLAEGLVQKGHKIFLFASSDSKTSGTLISGDLPSLGKNKEWGSSYKKMIEYEQKITKGDYGCSWAVKWKEVLRENYELLLARKLFQMAQKGIFDVVQLHSQPRIAHFSSLVKTPVVLTVHNTFTYPYQLNALKAICSSLPKNLYFVSLSNAQRRPLPNLNYVATVYNGIDIKKFTFSPKKGDYLAYAGRIVPQKGVDIAVRIAKKSGKKLKIAGPLALAEKKYWQTKIKPCLSQKITYEGMLSPKKMASFYQGAEALLVPNLLNEAFGLVMVEAMACGTPVIGFNRGSVPEIIKDHKTGYVVKNTQEMMEAVKKIDKIKREDCRAWVERKFTLEKMIDGYEKVYNKILRKNKR